MTTISLNSNDVDMGSSLFMTMLERQGPQPEAFKRREAPKESPEAEPSAEQAMDRHETRESPQPDPEAIDAALEVANETVERLSPLFVSVTENIPEQILSSLDMKWVRKHTESVQQELAANPDLADFFEQVIIQGDQKLLREKTKRQVDQLAKLYTKDQSVFRPKEWMNRSRKLAAFKTFTEGLTPVRRDSNPRDTYLPPRETGSISSFGPQDVFVQSDAYVYASFDKIRHAMSRGDASRVSRIDDADTASRSEIVMQDIAEIEARYPRKMIEGYTNNMFDYKQGKEVLALYLAMVFDSPEDAVKFLERNSGRQNAQQWETRLDVQDRDQDPEWVREENQHMRDVREKMLHLLEQTGIEPPLNLEVRIRGTAKIVT